MIRQDFANGAELWVGGDNAFEELAHGLRGDPITFVVDARGDGDDEGRSPVPYAKVLSRSRAGHWQSDVVSDLVVVYTYVML
jgi:hypothetical protein